MVLWGRAAWPPLPFIVISRLSEAAIAGPGPGAQRSRTSRRDAGERMKPKWMPLLALALLAACATAPRLDAPQGMQALNRHSE